MKKPVLVIMAAGMGSRYGGMKQIDPVDEYGHIIVDFSIYDAYLAGFEEVIFVIKRENAEDFHNVIGNRIEKIMKVRYAFQELENLPEGFEVPAGRVKPWGTAHAILSCKDMIDGPFAVINADDYYGREAFKQIYDYLSVHEDNEKYQYAMVGYQLKNTLTEIGSGSLVNVREFEIDVGSVVRWSYVIRDSVIVDLIPYVVSDLVIADNCCNEVNFTCLDLSRFVNLRSIRIGSNCLNHVRSVLTEGLIHLESLIVGERSLMNADKE